MQGSEYSQNDILRTFFRYLRSAGTGNENAIYAFLQGFFNEDGNWSFREGMRKQIDFYYRNRKIIKRHLEMIEKQERHESTFEFEMDSRMMNTYQKYFN